MRELLRKLHRDYLDDKLAEDLKAVYTEYVKPYFGRNQTS